MDLDLLAAARAGHVAAVDNLLSSAPDAGQASRIEAAAAVALEAKQWAALELLAGHLASAGPAAGGGAERLADLLTPTPAPTLGEMLAGAEVAGLAQLSQVPGPVLVVGEPGTPLADLELVLEDPAAVLAAVGARQKELEGWAGATAVDGFTPAGAREAGGRLLPVYRLRVRHVPG